MLLAAGQDGAVDVDEGTLAEEAAVEDVADADADAAAPLAAARLPPTKPLLADPGAGIALFNQQLPSTVRQTAPAHCAFASQSAKQLVYDTCCCVVPISFPG